MSKWNPIKPSRSLPLLSAALTALAVGSFVWTAAAQTAVALAGKSDERSVGSVKADASASVSKRYGLTIKDAVGGTLTAVPRKKDYAEGETVSLYAVPECGYMFVKWTGGNFANADSTVTTIIMNASAVVSAEFKRVLPPVVRGSFADARDGKVYKTVQVCKYVWMAENLNYSTPKGGRCYDDGSANCAKYGRLYDWETAMSVCPAGWHAASHDEWKEIAAFARGWSVDNAGWEVAANALKAKSGWDSGGSGVDKFGFAALPGGFHGPADALSDKNITFHNRGKNGAWWAASPRDSAADWKYATRWYMEHRGADLSSYPADAPWICGNALESIPPRLKTNSLSVRCVRDEYAPVKAPDSVTLTVSAGRGGTVAGDTGKLRRLAGEGVTVSAVPDRGYLFDKWVGGPVENAGYTVTTAVVYSDTAVTATFKKSSAPPVNYGTLVDARDGKKYSTTTIGGKTWMAENLNYGAPRGSSCHGNDDADCGKYGRLYDWKTAMSACPAGTHLPTRREWDYLCRSAGGKRAYYNSPFWRAAANKLKAPYGWKQNGSGTNDYGFSAIASGDNIRYRDWRSAGDGQGFDAAWWTATDRNNNEDGDERLDIDNEALGFNIDYNSDAVASRAYGKNAELSVRCVADEAVKFPLTLKTTAGGTVAAIPNKALYDAGETVTITASPDSLHVFTRWTGGAVVRAENDTAAVVVSSAVSFTANFRKRSAPPVVYGAFTDARDGKTYKTVKIGGDTWTAENLTYKTDSSWCYKNADSNCVKYGRLYVYSAAVSACPAGWHLSTYKEWKNLARTVDPAGRFGAGKILKARNGWRWYWKDSDDVDSRVMKNANGADDYGFSALPGGQRGAAFSDFSFVGETAYWWTDIAGSVELKHDRNDISIGSRSIGEIYWGIGDSNGNFTSGVADGRGMGFSVRCVADGR